MSQPYEGTTVTIEIEIRDHETGDLADPTTLTIDVEAPNGTTSTINPGDIEDVSTGIRHAPLELTDSGWWDIIITTTGNYDVTKPSRVYASPLPFTP